MDDFVSVSKYELAYHLTPDLEEAGVKTHAQALESLVAQSGGAVLVSREPKKKHLSYPIRQKHYAYFGMLDFSAQPEAIEKINSQMKLQNHILRYLLLKKELAGKEIRTLGMERMRPRMKTHEPSASIKQELEQAKGKEEIKPEEMEKEIEEVLEKI